MNEFHKSFVESMEILANESMKKVSTTVTIEAKILKVVDSGLGIYKIEYMGNKFEAHTNNQSVQYSVNDKVYVLIPNGDFTKTKIIIGAIESRGDMYTSLDKTNFKYLEKTDNLFLTVNGNNSIPVNLCSYKEEEKKIDIILGQFGTIMEHYLKDYNTLAFSYKVKTEIPIQQRVKGNYGLKLRLYFKEENEDGIIESKPKDFIIDIHKMIGNPYNFSTWTVQKDYIQINNIEAYDAEKNPELYAFVEGFEQGEGKPDDIFISDISLKVVNVLSEENLSGYYLDIKAEQGELFLKGQYKSEKTLTPILKINGYDTEIKGYECYWFVEDTSIKNIENEGYLPRIGKVGWKCLNQEKKVVENKDGATTSEYRTDEYQYIVKEELIKTSLRYKCVIIYKKNILSSIIKISNLKSNIEFKLMTSKGSTNYIKNIGEVNLICRIFYNEITNSKEPFATIDYNWARYDKEKNYIDNFPYTLVRKNERVIIDNKEYYETEIKFSVASIDEINTINCTAKMSQVNNDSQLIETIIGTESIPISTIEDFNYQLSIQNGNVLYKYDADGDSPMVATYNGELSSKIDKIKPLSYEIRKRDGSELTENEYSFCEAEWTIPKNSMIEIDKNINYEEKENNYIIKGKGRIEVPYSIAPCFNYSNRSNSTVFLSVKIDNDNTVKASETINFLKDGENGTNGTKYAAIITYEDYGYRELDEDGNFRKLQLIYIKNSKNSNRPSGWYCYDINSKDLLSFNIKNPSFKIKVFKNDEQINNSRVEWSFFDKNATNPCFKINENGVLSKLEDWSDSNSIFCNIVQAKVVPNEGNSATNADESLYAYYPIEITYLHSEEFANSIIPSLEGGFSSVLYASDGTNPRYTSLDFKCLDNLYDNDAENLYDYTWSTSKNLSYVETVENSCKIAPNSQYDNGESKNYVRVALEMSAEKKEEAEKRAKEYKEKITENENLYNYYNNNYKSLEAFAAQFSYLKYINYLNESAPMLTERANSINIINIILNDLNDFKDFCENNENRRKDIEGVLNYTNLYNTSHDKIISAKRSLYSLGETSSQNLNTIKSLSCTIILSNYEKETLRKILGIGAYLTLENLIRHYNLAITLYNDSYNLLKSKTNETNSFINLRTEIKNFCNSSSLINLINEHDGQPKNSEFELLQKELIALSNSFSVEELQNHTYENIKNKIILAIKLKIENYAVIKTKESGKTTLNNYYEKEFKKLIKDSEDKKIEAESFYNFYNNIQITSDKDSIVHIRPIIMIYNRYEMSAINGWDGNKLYTGSDDEGEYLFAPQLGAGRKEKNGNFFTGMIMGLRKNDNLDNNVIDVGLFGYKNGIQTLFLNAIDGSSIFGMSGAGQIVIQPGDASNKKAIIYGGNYIDGSSGLIIDLTTPEIKFGSGNFVVNAEGYLTAKGGGSIAGWEINDTTLSKQTEDRGKISLDSSSMSIYSHNHNSIESTNEGFYLGPDGMSLGNTIRILDDIIYIGSINRKRWTISGKNNQSYIAYNTEGIAQEGYLKSNSVYIGTDGISLGKYFKVANDGMLQVGHLNGKHWRMYANTVSGESFIYYGSKNIMPVLNAEKNSVYIGTDGIGLGKYFKVANDGTVSAGNIRTEKHWTITSRGDDGEAYIAYRTSTFNTDSNSVYIGTDGISLGNNDNFWVTADGKLQATFGIVGGWTLAKKYLISIKDNKKGIKIDSDGEIKAGVFKEDNTLDTNENYWIIDSNGKATFQDIYANKGGQIAGWNISSNKLFANNIEINSEGSLSGGETYNWSIKKDGIATFAYLVASTGGSIAGWKISSDGLTGGNMYIKSEGSIGGSNWSISKEGVANFENTASFSDVNVTGGKMAWPDGFSVNDDGSINAPSGKIGPWFINDDGISDLEDKSRRQVFITPTGQMKIGASSNYIEIDGTKTKINIIANTTATLQGASVNIIGNVSLKGTVDATEYVNVANGNLTAKTITTDNLSLTGDLSTEDITATSLTLGDYSLNAFNLKALLDLLAGSE